MKILFYLAKRFNLYFITLLIIFLAIDLIFSLIGEIKGFTQDGYNLTHTISFALLGLPRKAYILTPWISMLATLLSLGTLAKSSELTILQVSGLSPWKIARIIIISSLPLLVLLFISGEVIAPKADRLSQNIRARGQYNTGIIVTEDGVWSRHGNNFIQIMGIPSKNELTNLTIFNMDNRLKIKSITNAENAIKTNNAWELNNIVTFEIHDNHMGVIKEDKIVYENFINTNILGSYRPNHIDRLSLTKLYLIIKERKANNLATTEYQAALWKKITQPLISIMMILLAVPLTFVSLRKSSIGAKIVLGVLIGFVVNIINSIFYSLAILSAHNIILISFLPKLLILIPAIFFFQRVNR